MWAVDLDIGYSNSLAMSQLFGHVAGGQFNFSGGLFEIPIAKKMKEYEEHEEKRHRDHREWEGELIPMVSGLIYPWLICYGCGSFRNLHLQFDLLCSVAVLSTPISPLFITMFSFECAKPIV